MPPKKKKKINWDKLSEIEKDKMMYFRKHYMHPNGFLRISLKLKARTKYDLHYGVKNEY